MKKYLENLAVNHGQAVAHTQIVETIKNRTRNFTNLSRHALRCYDFDKLNNAEVEWAYEFIYTNSHLNLNEYIQLINRLTIDAPAVRSRNKIRIWGLLLEAATIGMPKKPRRK